MILQINKKNRKHSNKSKIINRGQKSKEPIKKKSIGKIFNTAINKKNTR